MKIFRCLKLLFLLCMGIVIILKPLDIIKDRALNWLFIIAYGACIIIDIIVGKYRNK